MRMQSNWSFQKDVPVALFELKFVFHHNGESSKPNCVEVGKFKLEYLVELSMATVRRGMMSLVIIEAVALESEITSKSFYYLLSVIKLGTKLQVFVHQIICNLNSFSYAFDIISMQSKKKISIRKLISTFCLYFCGSISTHIASASLP